MFRALIAERFPDHQVLAEEMGGAAARPAGPCWVFDPIDGTTNFAHGAADFLRVARARDRRRRRGRRRLRPEAAGAVHGRARRRRVSERRADARVRPPQRSSTRCSSPGFPTTCTRASTRSSDCSPRSSGRPARSGAWARRPSTCATSRPGAWTASGKRDLKPWDIAGGALIVEEAGGRVTDSRRAVRLARRPRAGDQRPAPRRDARGDPRRSRVVTRLGRR